jgi:hypothetical protein
MKRWLCTCAIAWCFIIGALIPNNMWWGIVLELLFYLVGFVLIDFHAINYHKWMEKEMQ